MQATRRFVNKLPPGDAAIIAAVISARPDYFVTSDKPFLGNSGMAEEAGLKMVNPARFIRILKSVGECG